MTTYSDPAAAVQHHTLTFKICSHDRTDPVRVVDVHASPEEIVRLVADGYLVRERLFSPEQVEQMRRALDEVAEREVEGGAIALSASRRFGGLFLRHLMDKHPVFLEMFRYEPTLSVARAVLGPQVQVRPMTGRISYPDESRQE
ncbi:MAG TPA: phytanoyl-CoA dioxygenase family protein, partial [Chthonomonadaceae bacterium]|nr:phytanoyl-CoA dioxygenase family protein [Chthonomonadaceae bacterium]